MTEKHLELKIEFMEEELSLLESGKKSIKTHGILAPFNISFSHWRAKNEEDKNGLKNISMEIYDEAAQLSKEIHDSYHAGGIRGIIAIIEDKIEDNKKINDNRKKIFCRS